MGVTSPLLADLVSCAPTALELGTTPRPGIMGVLSELVEALPLTPKGNFVSNAPESEFEEVLGREEPPIEPQLLAWAWPFC